MTIDEYKRTVVSLEHAAEFLAELDLREFMLFISDIQAGRCKDRALIRAYNTEGGFERNSHLSSSASAAQCFLSLVRKANWKERHLTYRRTFSG